MSFWFLLRKQTLYSSPSCNVTKEYARNLFVILDFAVLRCMSVAVNMLNTQSRIEGKTLSSS